MAIDIAVAFVLTAYSKMGGYAEQTVAQANLNAIVPFVHAYAVEHGDYSDMTIRSLQRQYGPSLDPSVYTLVNRGSADFCIATTYSGHTWHMSAKQAKPVAGGCESR